MHEHTPNPPVRFNLSNVIYYYGGLIAIGAVSLFVNRAWENLGGYGIFALALGYAIIGLGFAHLYQKHQHRIPASICATFVIVLTPLAIYGLQVGLGIWPDRTPYASYHVYIKWHWLYMELGTLIVGIIMPYIYRYPFMMLPMAVTLWYLSMDIAPMLIKDYSFFQYKLKALISMYFGLAFIFLAFWVDIRSRKSDDFAYWLYIFAVLTFWGGLTCQESNSELSKFFYCLINAGLILIGVVLMRRVFVVFGALGTLVYLSHLARGPFSDSYFFTACLSAIGFLIIYLGTKWQANGQAVTEGMQKLLPKTLRELIQARHQ